MSRFAFNEDDEIENAANPWFRDGLLASSPVHSNCSNNSKGSVDNTHNRCNSQPVNTSFLFSNNEKYSSLGAIEGKVPISSFHALPTRQPSYYANGKRLVNTSDDKHRNVSLNMCEITKQLLSIKVGMHSELEETYQRNTKAIEQQIIGNTSSKLNELQKSLTRTMNLQQRRKEEEEEKQHRLQMQVELENREKLKLEKEKADMLARHEQELQLQQRQKEEAMAAKLIEEEREKNRLDLEAKNKVLKAESTEQTKNLNQELTDIVPSDNAKMVQHFVGEKSLQIIIETMKQHMKLLKIDAQHADMYRKRMIVKRNIGQITNSRQILLRITQALDSLFKEAKSHPQHSELYYGFIMNIAAKSFAAQSETEIAVVPTKAFSFAHVIVLLFQNHPLFINYLSARMRKKCPYLIPIYPQRQPQSDTTHFERKVLRRRENEAAALYIERMNGSIALWSAIIQTKPLSGRLNPYGIDHGWQWIARILNLRPRDLTADLIRTFLQIVGPTFLQQFPRQGPKLLAFIEHTYLSMCPNDAVAAMTRLKMDLEQYHDNGNKLKVMKESRPDA